MDRPRFDAVPGVERVVAYDRRSVEGFFVAACERRARLLSEIAKARRRIAKAEAVLGATHDSDARIMAMVLDAYRQLNEDARSNKALIAQTLVNGAAEAENFAAHAKIRVEEMSQGIDQSRDAESRGPHQPAPVEPVDVRARPTASSARGHERRHHAAGGAPRPHTAAAAARKPVAPAWTVGF